MPVPSTATRKSSDCLWVMVFLSQPLRVLDRPVVLMAHFERLVVPVLRHQSRPPPDVAAVQKGDSLFHGPVDPAGWASPPPWDYRGDIRRARCSSPRRRPALGAGAARPLSNLVRRTTSPSRPGPPCPRQRFPGIPGGSLVETSVDSRVCDSPSMLQGLAGCTGSASRR